MTDLFGQTNPPPSPMTKSNSQPSLEQKCPYCGDERVLTRYRIGEHRILRCKSCTLMWLSPRPEIDDLHSVYDASYFQNAHFFDGTTHLYGYYDYFEERFMKQSAYQGLLRNIKKYLGSFERGKSRFLDIGCGLGYLMDVAHDEGFQVSGVEFNHVAAARLRSKYVFPVYSGDVLDFEDEPFDVITLMDVIEHFLDPMQSLAHIRNLVKPGGLLVLTTMDCDGIVSKLLGTRIEDFRRVREHVFFFTRRLMRDMLRKHGFDVMQIKYHGHHFRLGFLAHRLKLVSPAFGGLMGMCVKGLRIEQMTVYVNPLTKMIVYARRRA
jgi:2-polyprenyl-3-methyl-5-hydroxy-6-metoxy-1,4-benzoquinol methylase